MTQHSSEAEQAISSKKPVLFEEFFELGQQESVSPFITAESREWGANLTLKASLLAAFLLVIAFALSFAPHTIPLSYLILIVVYFLAGIPALIEAIEDLSNFDINIDILMTLAAFSSVLIGSSMEGALLLVLFALSGAMEDSVTAKAKGALSSLHKLSPTRASVIEENGVLVERSVRDISVDTRILVKSGQIVPLDGIVVDGISSVNLVHLTGENLPVTKKIGDLVPAGARNLEGALTVNVTRTSGDSTLARIIQLVVQAQEARPTLQRWFDKASRKYAVSIILLSALFALSFPFLLGIPFLGIEGSIYRALAFLIAASPCALIIAIPIAYLSAVSICAKKGILLKGGITLDALASCHAMAFDKTGTLTTGELSCLEVRPLNKNSNLATEKALEIAYALEKNAVHPIAKAILTYSEERKIQGAALKNFKAIPGYGLEAIVLLNGEEQEAYIGKAEYISERISSKDRDLLAQSTDKIQERGELLAVMLVGKELFLFRFSDTLRPKINNVIQAILKRGWDAIMLTGDHEESAKRIAKEAGIKEYYADLSPEDKLNHIANLSEKKGLAMIGDGINDAPALARATVGICMGKVGSTAAIDAADIVLLHDNIELIDWLISKAKQTQLIVRQNLILAISAIFIASLPALAGVVPLWLAVVMHEGGTVLVGLNALRLLWK